MNKTIFITVLFNKTDFIFYNFYMRPKIFTCLKYMILIHICQCPDYLGFQNDLDNIPTH